VISFYSSRDWVLLGLGTAMWGTMDGRHAISAGNRGFNVPDEPARAGLYRKLHQISWNREMADTGHTGGHLSSGTSEFVSVYVAPLVMSPQWDDECIARVLKREPVARRDDVPPLIWKPQALPPDATSQPPS
jgi:hypothetical protein